MFDITQKRVAEKARLELTDAMRRRRSWAGLARLCAGRGEEK
jgi:hypothetical protein